jgi:hypothetical protein
MEPFDARRAMLMDMGRPHSEWRSVSLVSALRASLQEARPVGVDDPAVRTNRRPIVDELTARGFDGDSLVRFGLTPEIVVAVFAQLLVHWVPTLSEPPVGLSPDESHQVPLEQIMFDMPAIPVSETNGWRHLLAARIEAQFGPIASGDRGFPSFEGMMKIIHGLMQEVIPWIFSSPLDELLALRPPSVEYLDSLGEADIPPLEGGVHSEYRWLVERFSFTRISQWSTSSLHLEHEWLAGNQPSSCPDEIMRDRLVLREELTTEIARRAIQQQNSGPVFKQDSGSAFSQVGLGAAMAAKMQSRAVELLRANRFREAAALYEFAVTQDPRDPDSANNLGFCLIREDPREALNQLQRAHMLGYAAVSVNVYNRSLCHVILRDFRAALDLIEANWSKASSMMATLWVFGADGLVLEESLESRTQLAKLALRAADNLGDVNAIRRWGIVLEELGEIENPTEG